MIFCVLAVVLPPVSFSYNRYKAGVASGNNHIKEFYRLPALEKANQIATLHKFIINDIKSLKKITAKNDIVLYFEPAYIALLSNRFGKKITFIKKKNLYSIDNIDDADYVYLSKIHPRKTSEGINGLNIYPYMKEQTELIRSRKLSDTDEPVSLFLKVKKQTN